DDPTRPPADILAAQDSAMAPARGLAAARAALAVGAGRRALAALLDEPAPASLRADAHALVGELEKAVEIEDEPESAARRIQRAERLLRLGRWKEAKREAIRAVREDSSLRDQARVIEATVLRERGDLEAASAILTTPAAYPWSVRLALLQSDLAASHGNTEEAEQLAERALSLSEDDALRAQAHARIAAAFAARGEWRPARTRYALARELFERTDDFSGWPAYVMNVATADHALGDFGRAIEGYGAAERLAERFRRPITAAAAATNLASLLLAVGAHDEARVVLERAKAQSAAINYAMYGALCLLIEAELVGREHPEEGTHLALRARDEFRSLGASKQAWEATLVAASFGDASPLDPEAIEAVGLSARLWLVDGRRALNDGQPALAADLAARALKRCESDDDRLRVLEALELCAASSPRADEASRFKDRAAALRKAIAETLPAGLRLRFDRPKQPPPAVGGGDARRVLALARRVLMERDEQRLYAFALDEAVAMTGAERAFLLKRIPKKRPQVVVARNIDREHIRRSRFRFSRSVAEKVLSSGEPFLTARAAQDPALESAQSVHAMGLRSILCVPIRSPDAVVAALYLDHRFSEARFGSEERELLAALADLLGLAIENARLHAASQRRNEELSLTAQRAQQESAHRAAEITRLASELAKAEAGEDSRVLVRSGPMRRVIDLVERAAPTDLTVLIEGESGTGKEVFAREIHARSGRSEGTFVGINCGALSETLLESELFGHVRGAFTDAIRDSPGLFRSARGGTLLLDEVGEMPPRMQTRLLRVLQERVVRPVGGGAEVPVDVRVIAATNRDLNAEVEAGRFRQDLYFRLAAVQLTLPPLRERREEIPALVTTLLARIAREPGMRQLSASRDALRELMLHDWPGNIRELEQALRRAVLMADGERLDASHLDLGQTIQPRRVALQRHDAKLVEDALRACDGNKSRTARALGISRPTLYRWMQRYGLH
ncbi:MAG: sigma 54-interacting transcriptional regulator, partial [Myxococcota bacterium]